MKIASWNVNSLKMRLAHVLRWLEHHQPDLLCLQETKCADDAFPRQAIEKAGWHVLYHGQKTYNGVAIISKQAGELVQTKLPAMKKDAQARYIEALFGGVRVICLYAPNGNPIESDKFPYKLKWLEALEARARALLAAEEKIILLGDFNIIPEAADVWDESVWLDDALYHPEARAAFRKLRWLGFTDAIAACLQGQEGYTFWNYQRGAWAKNHGIRIDHILLSPQAADCLVAAGIDRDQRGREKPSDHVPVWVEL